ncbi:hypothetical protein ABT025_18795 [Streptomyces sp. NPDC002809]|uniref:hypothetical protein n=1 Tax=Streptomyces sp. NPDC002809 TaxID=3154433 RepID=UPI0033346DBD
MATQTTTPAQPVTDDAEARMRVFQIIGSDIDAPAAYTGDWHQALKTTAARWAGDTPEADSIRICWFCDVETAASTTRCEFCGHHADDGPAPDASAQYYLAAGVTRSGKGAALPILTDAA